MFRGIIFDLGNTLMYFNGDWDMVIARGANALTQFLLAKGCKIDRDFGAAFIDTRRRGRERSAATDVEYTAEHALRDTLRQCAIEHVPHNLILRALEVYFEPEERMWVAYDDAHETLRTLQAHGLRLGLISNATDDNFVQRAVRHADLATFLDPIISSAAVPWRKPDIRIFQHVLNYWNYAPDEVAMVGDWAGTDILGAHRAGMPAILIQDRWSEAELKIELPKHVEVEIPDKHLLAPDARIRNLSELPPTIEELSPLLTKERQGEVRKGDAGL
jgi:HAD superfamily hydrolase (TIGR01662 family)